jgi:hypothetical protein
MLVPPAGAVIVKEPHVGVADGTIPTALETIKGLAAGTGGKVWLKAKPVNGMAALLVMVNVKSPLAVPPPVRIRGLGTKSMVKVGAGTVSVRLIAAVVALGAWLLLRVTGELIRAPGAVAVT